MKIQNNRKQRQAKDRYNKSQSSKSIQNRSIHGFLSWKQGRAQPQKSQRTDHQSTLHVEKGFLHAVSANALEFRPSHMCTEETDTQDKFSASDGGWKVETNRQKVLEDCSLSTFNGRKILRTKPFSTIKDFIDQKPKELKKVKVIIISQSVQDGGSSNGDDPELFDNWHTKARNAPLSDPGGWVDRDKSMAMKVL